MDTFSEHTFTSQDGLSLYYRTYGPQRSHDLPILCLPGLTRNADDFHDLAERLGGSRQVISLDYRGRGRSAYDPNPKNYQPRTYLEDIRHLLAIVGVHRVIVVGTSMGGLLAMGLASSHPHWLSFLTTLDRNSAMVFTEYSPTQESTGRYRIGTVRPTSFAASSRTPYFRPTTT